MSAGPVIYQPLKLGLTAVYVRDRARRDRALTLATHGMHRAPRREQEQFLAWVRGGNSSRAGCVCPGHAPQAG